MSWKIVDSIQHIGNATVSACDNELLRAGYRSRGKQNANDGPLGVFIGKNR